VMRGCNHYCSYCIVPYVRGREKSRPVEDIVAEAEQLVADGIREIMLLGQNVAAYGRDLKVGRASCLSIDRQNACRSFNQDSVSPFAELLRAMNGIDSLARIRFTSPHPAYFNDSLIDAMVALPKVCKSLHLPLQSGSDRMLQQMNRHYTAEDYLQIIKRLIRKSPGITFSTDIIIGFPGETEADFLATRELMNEVSFDNAYIFKYSPREGTKAADFADDVPQEVKEERNQILLADLKARTERHNQALVGQTVEILVEGESKRNPQRWSGRTSTNKVVVFDLDPAIKAGDMIKVKIARSTSMTLFGEAL